MSMLKAQTTPTPKGRPAATRASLRMHVLPRTKTKPMTVTFLNGKTHDFEVALLGSYGFSRRYAVEQTGLTPSQITYRLHKAGIRLRDYRDGTNVAAKAVMEATKPTVEPALQKTLKGKGLK